MNLWELAESGHIFKGYELNRVGSYHDIGAVLLFEEARPRLVSGRGAREIGQTLLGRNLDSDLIMERRRLYIPHHRTFGLQPLLRKSVYPLRLGARELQGIVPVRLNPQTGKYILDEFGPNSGLAEAGSIETQHGLLEKELGSLTRSARQPRRVIRALLGLSRPGE